MEKYQCSQCPRNFKRQEHLKRHQKCHESSRAFECDVCHKSFTRSDILSKHSAIHDHSTAVVKHDAGRRRACLECAKAREKCSRNSPCQRCSARSLNCTYPTTRDKGGPLIESPASQADSISHTPSATPINSNDGINIRPGAQPLPSNLNLELTTNQSPYSQASPFGRGSGEAPNQQPPNFEYDLSACDIDWDFPINWLPYDNEIETNYFSILGAGADQPIQASGDGHPMINNTVANFPIINPQPRRLSTVTSVSPGSGLGVTTQLSVGSDRTIPGDLYASSSNGARRPCTAKSKQLFPPPGLDRYKELPPISQDTSLRVQSEKSKAFPDASHIIVEEGGHHESILTDFNYNQIYDAFTQTCLDSSIFQRYTSAHFPSRNLLDYCIRLFFEHFNPIFPLVHPQTTDLNGSWILSLAVCVIGAQYSATTELDTSVEPFHEFLRRALVVQFEGSDMTIPLAQALVLSQVGMMYYGGCGLRQNAYTRVGNLQTVINMYHTRSATQAADFITSQTGQTDEERWFTWVEDETLRRLCYSICLLDRMGEYFFNDHQPAAFKVSHITLPHDVLWAQTTSSDWIQVYRRVDSNPTLATALGDLFRERTAKTDLGEFSRIVLLHAVYQEYTTVNTYCKRPLSSWIPQNNPERNSDETHLLHLSHSNWRNAALDCVDTLHWAANATIASLLGAEHPTVLHLHFSRVVLLVPRTAIVTLARYLQEPGNLRKAESQQGALQAEREISEWAQQDGSKARLAALHCGCFLWHVRRYAKMAFYEPPCVFWATLTLWAYSVYCSKSQRAAGDVPRQVSSDHSDDDNPTFIRLDRPNDDEMVQLFVRTGVSKAYISGVGDIYAETAPRKILKEGKRVLESVSLAWGRSVEYLNLLDALK
ncbi:hypothetical protein BKA59DRAFT_499871 [Fusarium tricinctum]|uniref:Zinc finger protein n=1 Tax=Fusarium tricinctum TaxID=61284 RepID=A0A8K0WDA6_9HYPO|nr:hypothetical protein BKA59DRAFT_499871 [Fusarium tricinctum]